MRTLEADGRLEVGALKPGTLRKLLRQAGLDRVAVRDGSGPKNGSALECLKMGS